MPTKHKGRTSAPCIAAALREPSNFGTKIKTKILNQEPTCVPRALQLIVAIKVIHPTTFHFPAPRTFGAKFGRRIVLGRRDFG